MRLTHASPKRRRHGRTPFGLPALVLLAGLAQVIAPASAAAMDGQGTGTGSTCIERAPGVFIDSVTREKCEPVQLPGETIVVRDPYKAPDPSPPRLPACSALVHKCGQAEEGRVPQRKPSEKDFGREPSRNRGPGAVKPAKDQKKPAKDAAKPGADSAQSGADAALMLDICHGYMWAGGFHPEDILPGGRIRSAVERHLAEADFWRMFNARHIARLFSNDHPREIYEISLGRVEKRLSTDDFAREITLIRTGLEEVETRERDAYLPWRWGPNPTDEQLKARDAFTKAGCGELMQPDRK